MKSRCPFGISKSTLIMWLSKPYNDLTAVTLNSKNELAQGDSEISPLSQIAALPITTCSLASEGVTD